jgi:hypothetical protein
LEYWNGGIKGKRSWNIGIGEHWVNGKGYASVLYSYPTFQYSNIPLPHWGAYGARQMARGRNIGMLGRWNIGTVECGVV